MAPGSVESIDNSLPPVGCTEIPRASTYCPSESEWLAKDGDKVNLAVKGSAHPNMD
jgi:hypothetical protein